MPGGCEATLAARPPAKPAGATAANAMGTALAASWALPPGDTGAVDPRCSLPAAGSACMHGVRQETRGALGEGDGDGGGGGGGDDGGDGEGELVDPLAAGSCMA